MPLVKKNNFSGDVNQSFDGQNPQSHDDVFFSTDTNLPPETAQNDKANILYKLLVYLNTAVIFVFLLGIGFLAYKQFIKNAPLNLAFFPGSSSASRALNFQGRITDDTGEPITGSINMRFKIYDALSGGSELWYSGAGGCTLTADSDGIFSVGLGDDCGGDLTSAVYNSSSSGLWLEIDVYDDGDTVWETLTPRQPIRTVMFAFNAETLQGYYPSTSATIDQIPVINSSGNLVLSSSSPTFQSTSGDFTIEGNTSLTLTTAIGSNGNISLSPDGLGEIILGANVGIGTTNPSLGLDVGGGTYSISEANDVGISGDLEVLGTLYASINATTLSVNNLDANTITVDYLDAVSASVDYLSVTTLSADQITTNFDEGSVIFTDASGNLDSDTSQFFWDDTNNRLGIGTSSPDEKLHLAGGTLLVDTPNPTLAGTYDTSGFAYGVYVSGKYAYVADYNSGLQIIDISNPSSPTLEGTYDTSGSAYDVYISGQYAYVADYNSGLQIIDISNPNSPTLKGTYDTSGSAYSVYISGKYAYVADYNSGLQIIDISNPSSPSLVGTYDTSGYTHSVYVSGKYAYIADDSYGLQIINISNPSAPALAGAYVTDGLAYDVYISGKYAYVADYVGGLKIIDISNPSTPTLVGQRTTIRNAYGVYVSGEYAYVAINTSGLQIIDISNPSSPSTVGTYDTSGTAYNVSVSGKYAYVADYTSGLQIINIGGADIHAANIGNINTNDLTVWENIDIGNNAYIRNGLNVGPGGLYVDAGEVAFDGNSSATAFRFGQSGTGDILNVFDGSSEIFTILDGGNVGIGTTNPWKALQVIGDTRIEGSTDITPVQLGNVLTASDAANSDYYGSSVAISGDGLVMAVGAIGWEGSYSSQGGVYIYDYTGGAWVQRGSVLSASDAASGDYFGKSVALSPDASVLIVGANEWEGSVSNQGGVYIYDYTGGAWVQRGSVLTSSDATTWDSFGSAVALSEDKETLVVGAPEHDGATSRNGAVYIYDYIGGAWTQRGTHLTASDGESLDYFGKSVALSADAIQLIIGASHWDVSTDNDQGGIYLYNYQNNSWIQNGNVLTASDANLMDYFGYGIAFNDNQSMLTVGANFWEGSLENQGGIYTFNTNSAALDVVGDIHSDSTIWASAFSSNSPFLLQTKGTTRLYIDDSSGNVGIGTTAPSTFKLEVNGSVGPASAPTITNISQSITSLDNTAGFVGLDTSIAIGTDSLPVISYRNYTSGDLKVAKCSNTTCTSATLTSLDTTGDVGLDTSIAIGIDSLPIISYYDDTNDNLKVAKCSNTSCTAATITSLDTTGVVGSNTSIAIGTDGLPIISYYDDTNDDLKVAKCSNASCTAATITSLDTTGNVGLDSSIAIGTDGLPVISYYDTTNEDLKVAKCSNASCTSATLTSLDTTGNVGSEISIAIGTDGLPVISYHDTTNGDLKVAKCSNASCTAATLTSLDTTGDTGYYPSIDIGTDGLPVISYRDTTNGYLKVAKCNNTTCTAATLTSLDTTVDAGYDTSIVIGTDSLPMISYFDVTNTDLKVAHCATESCSQTSGSYYAGGSDLGSRAKYFNNTYAVNYWAKEGMAISNFDLAEDYTILGKADFGDLVSVALNGNKAVTRSTKAYQDTLLGIVSTKPGIRLSEWDNPQQNQKPIALAGRVPVKVTSINGHILAGDHLTSSPLPGIAMLASKSGMTVGTALENTNFDKEACASVFKLADISWPDDDGTNSSKPCFKVPVASLDSKIRNELITNYGLTESDFFYVGKIMTFVNVSHFEPEIVKLKLDKLANAFSFDNFGFLKTNKLIAVEISVSTLSADSIWVGSLSVDTVSVNNLVSSKATIYGPLTTDLLSANTIIAHTLSADRISTDSLLASSAVLGEATISGTLYADHIHGLQDKILDSLQDSSLLSSASHGPSMADIKNELSQEGLTLASNLQTTLDELELSKDDIVLSPSAAYLDKYLEVNGNAYISKSLGIADNLQIGTGLFINSDGLTKQGIYSITADKIQLNPLGTGSLSLMADTLVIDQKGEVIVNGDLKVTGKIVSNEIEVTNNIKILGTTSIGKKLEIDSEEASSSSQVASDKSTGKAFLQAGQTSVTLNNSLITDNSLIYITPISNTSNQVIFVNKQVADNPDTTEVEGYFTVTINEPVNNDIYFNWWIIN